MSRQTPSRDQREMTADIMGCKERLGELVYDFLGYMVPGPKQRRLAKAIIDLTRDIVKKEEELTRIKKMSKEYSRRRS